MGLAPCRICAASWSEPAKLKRTFASLNCLAQVVKASLSDAAADTVRVGFEEPLLPLLPHPADRQGERRRPCEHAFHAGLLSIITEVAFTVAVAGTPGAKPSSATESRVTAAVTRCGPASISTSAITPSISTERTIPGNRLRADSEPPARCRRGRGASRSISLTGTSRRLRASRDVRSLPLRSQRRSVSVLTPRALAASPNVRVSAIFAQLLHSRHDLNRPQCLCTAPATNARVAQCATHPSDAGVPAAVRNDEGPARAGPPRSRSAGLQGSCKSYALVGLDSGGGIRTRDLRVMSPTSYQTAPPRGVRLFIAKAGLKAKLRGGPRDGRKVAKLPPWLASSSPAGCPATHSSACAPPATRSTCGRADAARRRDALRERTARADALLCMLTDRGRRRRCSTPHPAARDRQLRRRQRQHRPRGGARPAASPSASRPASSPTRPPTSPSRCCSAIARRLPEGEAAVRAGEWLTWGPDWLLGRDVHGATLGIVGRGRIGAAVARRAEGFGMTVLHHSRSSGVPLDELLARADFVSLHVPLTPETRHLIDAAALERMRPTAYLVNTARGGIVDQDALAAALHDGAIAGAALDVTDPEPLPPDHPLLGAPNLIVLPHLGSATHATRRAMADLAVDNLLAALGRRAMPHLAS